MKFLGNPSSGSYREQTYSRNRFGQYIRNRATPVNPATPDQLVQRAVMAANAAAWRALTDAQRAGWLSLGSQMSRTDSLGQAYTLNGFGAYCSVNNNKASAGDALVSAAPALITPGTLASVTLTLTAAAFSVAYTPTPLPANNRAFIYVSRQKSAGTIFNGSYFLLAVTAAAAASPANILAAYTAKYGVPVAGNRVFVTISLYNGGFLGAPFAVSQVVA